MLYFDDEQRSREVLPNEHVANTLHKFPEKPRVFERLIYAVSESRHRLHGSHGGVILIEFLVRAREHEAVENDTAERNGVKVFSSIKEVKCSGCKFTLEYEKMIYLTKVSSDVCMTSHTVDIMSELTSFPTKTARSNSLAFSKTDNMYPIIIYCYCNKR